MRLLFLLSLSPILLAQAPTALTLAQAEQLAVQRNPQLSEARFTAAAEHQTPLEQRAALLPNFTGLVTAVGADSGSRLAAGGLNNPVVYDRFATGVLVTQLVSDFGRTANLAAAANLRAQAQDQATEQTRADILVETARAYFGVLRAQSVLKVAQETVAARQLLSDQVTALANNNLKSGLDVSFANVNLADAQLLLAQAQNDLSSAQTQLAAAMGVPSQTIFQLAEEAMPGPMPDIDTLLQEAIQDRPDLKDFRLELLAAERSIRAEHALFYPTVGVAGTAGFVPAGEAAVPGRYGAIGINVSIPILNGGLFRARQTEAELRARAANERVNDLAVRVNRDVRVAYLNALTANERLGLTAKLLNQAELAMDLARGRYDLGLSSIVELSQAQLNLTSAQIANTTAGYDYQTQRAILDYQIGALR
jgi:outer membrane protein